ncbi:DUF2393 domain-containing protein [Sulfurimonas sp.]|nr:DUF2393 domain-containing protein [Sulfurimonas sp.]
MTNKITSFIDGMISYDYILFGSVFTVFILLIVLGILTRSKPSKSIIIFLTAFCIVLLGPTLGYKKMHDNLFKNSVSIKEQKKLTFTKAIIVYGNIKNTSSVDFSMCNIKVSASKVSGNGLKDYIFTFNPFKEASIIEYEIFKNEDRDFKIIVEPFTYSKDYNLSIGANCR